MLHLQAIDTSTLELLNGLMQVDAFAGLRLSGGTSLALQIGHRKSIDLDLFGNIEIDEISISKILSDYGKISIIKNTPNIHVFLVNNIKVDIVNYPYPWIDDIKSFNKLRLASVKDIAAMKFSAITGRGSKKDFIDLFFLLEQFSLSTIMDFYNQKYSDGSPFLVLKSLTYFDDADLEVAPVMLKDISWDIIKQSILNEVKLYMKNLS